MSYYRNPNSPRRSAPEATPAPEPRGQVVSVRGRTLAAQALLLASVLLLALLPPGRPASLAAGVAGGLGVFLAAWVLWDLWR